MVIGEARAALCDPMGGVEVAFRVMFSGTKPRIPYCNTSFATDEVP
jgi:hypothetical protein